MHMRCFFAWVPALTACTTCAHTRDGKGGSGGWQKMVHLEFHLGERMQCHWAPKIRFLASSRSPMSFPIRRSRTKTDQPTGPLLQHRVEAEVVHASNLRMLPGSHGQLLMLEVGGAGADIPPVVAGSWKLIVSRRVILQHRHRQTVPWQ